MRVERLDQLRELGQRPRQPVDLIDDDDVYSFGSDLIQQRMQGGALERGAGESAPSAHGFTLSASHSIAA
jgi:hypothetical protein